MAYVLAALIGRAEMFVPRGHDLRPVALPQGYALVPVTEDLAGRSKGRPFAQGDFPCGLTDYVVALAAEVSRTGAVAYVEVELFGGEGPTAGIVWRDGAVAVGPLHLDLRSPNSPPREQWPINVALAALGVQTGEAIDHFAALDLGRHRDTASWLPS